MNTGSPVRGSRVPQPVSQGRHLVIWVVALCSAILGALLPTPWWQLGIIAFSCAAVTVAGKLSHPAFRWSVLGAAGFLLLRVLYRVVFGSALPAASGEVVLLNLPAVPVGGPFAGIVLFGQLTASQLLVTLAEASRFVVVFLVFGAANACADVRTLLARSPQRVLPVATALSLALSALPAFFESVQRVLRAARMRGEPTSLRLATPVLEQAVERATALGASMELRGYGAHASTGNDHVGRHAPRFSVVQQQAHEQSVPTIDVSGLSVDFANRPVLRGVHLMLHAGECAVITGPTGAGKSTLLAALCGMIPSYTPATVSGSVRVVGTAPERPAQIAGTVALVPQRPERTFLAETVWAEVAFGLQQQRIPPDEVDERVHRALLEAELGHLAHREPSTLSAGETMRVALTAMLVLRPAVLLCDEPLADLDPHAATAVLRLIRSARVRGCAVVISEHRAATVAEFLASAGQSAVSGLPDPRWFALKAGELRADQGPFGCTAPERASAVVRGSVGPLVSVVPEPLTVQRDHRELLSVPHVQLHLGAVTVLRGPNGCGKTSLLEDIALVPGSKRGRRAGVALLPHRVDDLLIRDSIEAEFRFSDKRHRQPRGTTQAIFAELISGSLPPAPHTHPRDTSAGTRVLLALAVQLAGDPCVLLLDEPTRGLDHAAQQHLAAVLGRTLRGGERAVLLTTHDTEFARVLMRAGILVHERVVRDGEVQHA